MCKINPVSDSSLIVPVLRQQQIASKWHARVVANLRNGIGGFALKVHGHLKRILVWAGHFFGHLKLGAKPAPLPPKQIVHTPSPAAQQINASPAAKPPVFRPICRFANAGQAPALNPAEAQFQAFLTSMATMMGVSVYNRVIQPKISSYANDVKGIQIPGLPAAVMALISTRLAGFIQSAVNLVQNRADAIAEQKIQVNAQIIGQNLSARAVGLIQAANSPNPTVGAPTLYQQTFDQIVTIVYGHIQAVASVNGITDPNQRRLAFSKQKACDPRLCAMLDVNTGIVNNAALSTLETTIFTQLSQNLIALLLPNVAVNGVNTPGLVALMQQLQIAPALQNGYQQIFKDLPVLAQDACGTATSLIEQSIAGKVNGELQNGLAMGLQLGINQVISPDYLNMWMAQGALPGIFQALIAAVVKERLYSPSSAILQALTPLASSSNDFQTACNQIIPLLYQDLIQSCGDINFQNAGITQDVFATLMTPYLQNAAAYFQQQAAGKVANGGMITSWLRAFNASVSAGNNPTYGQVLMDFLFKLGNLNVIINKNLTNDICQDFLQNLVSRAMTGVMNPLRASDQPLLNGAVAALQQIMGNQAQVDAVLFDPAVPPVNVNAAYNQQLVNMSYITRDLILQLVNQIQEGASWDTKIFKGLAVDAIKQMVPSAETIFGIYNDLYQSLLTDRYINESLYFQIQDAVVKMFQNAAAVKSN